MTVRKPLAVVLGALAGLVLTAVPAAATPAPPPPLTGEHLGPDRLPRCADVVAAMSPRDKLAQRLMVGVDGADPRATAENVRATQVGAIFVGGNATALLTDQAVRGVRAMSRIPLAVAVDDEGGRVQRLDTLDGELPSARAMARSRTPDQVRELGEQRGREQLARGITMNLAPTVDVTGKSAAIGDRSFADDPDTVSRYADAFVEGQRAAGVYTVLKHFPGHGRASGDSHKGRVTTPPLADMRADDLRPYASLLGPGGPLADGRTGVLVGHLDVPGLTTDLPSSLTPEVYALLRGEIGFDGLVLTDDLGAMDAVTDEFTLPEAVERALEAGADMALWSSGGRITPVLDHLEQAGLDPAGNDAAVTRVLRAKRVCS
ncbi:glycoside hydrolase family 3 protein [Pseudonocardia sp. DSM 110487]|uniref:glycoside hydrolase family 3 N-terminal domain-containing protein n=1 Tax=Pseudonocardia sp. DSM 110487 TaxID=2865833 RepID=UPI001C69568A|nr:glycoside hydrolase family 3 N-terminal domain-containing protein [Pseudonocardia sp. DSM 110487]QYN37229.1 glycoside hydrolase family 3 protein [Pseudonocardia sp. DSM 110487]